MRPSPCRARPAPVQISESRGAGEQEPLVENPASEAKGILERLDVFGIVEEFTPGQAESEPGDGDCEGDHGPARASDVDGAGNDESEQQHIDADEAEIV